MRIHDTLLEAGARYQDNTRAVTNNKASNPCNNTEEIPFTELLDVSLQNSMPIVHRNIETQGVALFWLQYYLPKPVIKEEKSSVRLPFSELR